MKPAEIRELSNEQLAEKLKEARAELFNLRFQMATSQLDNTARVGVVKKESLVSLPSSAPARSQRRSPLSPSRFQELEHD